jgi:phenylpropionate dioxygenase-like ring-hydroxylating dioxygenase large terminal subunit
MAPEPDALDRLLRRSWHPVAVAGEIGTAPVAVTLLDEAIVLVRLGGQVRAFTDQCPHRGAALSLGWSDGAQLSCPYHGWSYDGSGACVWIPSLRPQPSGAGDAGNRIPTRANLQAHAAREHLGLVWVALEDPITEPPGFAEHDDPGIRTVPCPPYDWDCHAFRRIENFLDFAHFPWIHPGILGDPADPLVPPHEVTRDGPVVRVHQTRVEPANDDVKTMGLGLDEVVTSEMNYTVQLPLTAQLHQDLPGGRRYAVWLTASPVSATRTRTFWFVGRNYALDEDDDKFVRFQQDVVAQDRPIIESQRPARIPLALGDELHVKDDKFQVEYRRGLLELAAGL